MIFLNKKTNYLNKLQSNYYEFIGMTCVIRKVKIQNIGLFFILVVLTSACSSPPQNHFAHLLTDGYKVESNLTNKAMVLGFIDENRASCIYGVSPNRRVWQRINTFYKMINREFHKLSMPVYVKSVEACPAGTSIFVYLHESFENPAEAIYREETKLRYFLKLDRWQWPNRTPQESSWFQYDLETTGYLPLIDMKMILVLNQYLSTSKVIKSGKVERYTCADQELKFKRGNLA